VRCGCRLERRCRAWHGQGVWRVRRGGRRPGRHAAARVTVPLPSQASTVGGLRGGPVRRPCLRAGGAVDARRVGAPYSPLLSAVAALPSRLLLARMLLSCLCVSPHSVFSHPYLACLTVAFLSPIGYDDAAGTTGRYGRRRAGLWRHAPTPHGWPTALGVARPRWGGVRRPRHAPCHDAASGRRAAGRCHRRLAEQSVRRCGRSLWVRRCAVALARRGTVFTWQGIRMCFCVCGCSGLLFYATSVDADARCFFFGSADPIRVLVPSSLFFSLLIQCERVSWWQRAQWGEHHCQWRRRWHG